jgi:hypothetical protein
MIVGAALLLSTAIECRVPPVHDKAYWHAVAAHDFTPPDGALPEALAPELLDDLGSTDPELRDELAATILTGWIYRTKSLGPAAVAEAARTLVTNLNVPVGEPEGNGVLRRSFSALILSVIVARDNDTRVLADDLFRAVLDGALIFFAAERDVRGFDDRIGWIHSAAHTADLLKFLARNDRLTVADQHRIFAAITGKLRLAPVTFFTGEDERIARVPISLVRRDDADTAGFETWLGDMSVLARFPTAPTSASLRAMTNARHVLSALSTELSVDARPSPGADAARAALKAALTKLF